VRVTARAPFTLSVDLADEQGGLAVEQYLRDGHPAADVATALRVALELRRTHDALSRERADVEQRRNDLEQGAEETRQNLSVIMRNPQAADLRAQLTARLARVATQLDQMTRRVVELAKRDGWGAVYVAPIGPSQPYAVVIDVAEQLLRADRRLLDNRVDVNPRLRLRLQFKLDWLNELRFGRRRLDGRALEVGIGFGGATPGGV
jgi:hypothetical protein